MPSARPGMYGSIMAQVTVHLPADLLAAARARAVRENKSLSAWLGALIGAATGGLIGAATDAGWPDDFVALLRSGHGDIVEPDDPPPGNIDVFP